MTKVLVIQGAGMNMRGKSQVEIFGPTILEQFMSKSGDTPKDWALMSRFSTPILREKWSKPCMTPTTRMLTLP